MIKYLLIYRILDIDRFNEDTTRALEEITTESRLEFSNKESAQEIYEVILEELGRCLAHIFACVNIYENDTVLNSYKMIASTMIDTGKKKGKVKRNDTF